jgi:PKD repeat protein
MRRVVPTAGAFVLILASCDHDSPASPARSMPHTQPALSGSVSTSSANVSPLGNFSGYDSHIAQGINASGRPVGLASGGTPPVGYPQFLAVAFDPAAEVFVSTSVPGAPEFATDAYGINDGGVISGTGSVDSRRRSYAGGGNWLPQLPGGINQFGGYINNAGEVVGTTSFDVNNTTPGHATLWEPDAGTYTATDLGLFGGRTIEPRGLAPNLSGANRIIVGRYIASTFNGYTALRWDDGSWTELAIPEDCVGASSWATDVSDGGIAVGMACNGAALWTNGVFRSLHLECQTAYGTDAGGGEARGIAVTPSGRTIIVGTCIDQPAVWYDDGAGGFICELLPLLAGDTAGDAYDVNASGQIVGRTNAAGPSHAVRWVFTIPPAGGRPPNAAHGGAYTGTEGVAVAFDGSGSSDPDADPLTFDWDFGDGSPHGTGATPSHTYADNGLYTVTVTVSDGTGNSDVATTSATIANAAPQVSAGAESSLESGDVLAFTGSFSDAGTADGPWLTSIAWDDGTAATTGSTNTQGSVGASHTYFSTGVFTLQLTVTDKNAAPGAATRSVTVTPRAVAFSIAPSPISLGSKKAMQIEVVVLSTPTFDAGLIDPASLRLGNGVDPDAEAPQKKNGSYAVTVRDLNRDGRRDFSVSIDKTAPNLGLAAPSTNLVLRAAAPTAAGTIVIRSSLTVNVVP